MKRTFKSENTISGLLQPGDHKVMIVSVAETLAAANADHSDRTPQIEVKFRAANGKQLTQWLNLEGYKRYAELSEADKKICEAIGADGIAVNKKTRERVIDADRTKSALSIISKLGNDAGIPSGEDFEPESLVDMEIGIHVVTNEQNNLRVKYTMPASKVGADEVSVEA